MTAFFLVHQSGDVIDFISQLFDLTPYQAAWKLAEDFGLHPGPSNTVALAVPTRQAAETASTLEGRCAPVLIAYVRLLKSWKESYAPPDPESAWDVHYIVACNALLQVSYLLDCLSSADAKERAETVDALLQELTLDKINSFWADHPADDANMAVQQEVKCFDADHEQSVTCTTVCLTSHSPATVSVSASLREHRIP